MHSSLAGSNSLPRLTLRHRVPTIFQYRDFAIAGGLITYGGSRAEASRHLGLYAARILKGENPADLPVLQATKVELVINLKTAKALGLSVPATLLARADELIDRCQLRPRGCCRCARPFLALSGTVPDAFC